MDRLYDPTIQPASDQSDGIQTALSGVLIPEAAVVVVSYAVEKPYIWPRKPYTSGVLITDNIIVSRASAYTTPSRWIRIVASQSVSEGAYRWRIRTEFDPSVSIGGFIAVGVSNAAVGITIVNGSDWKDIATANDFLVSTCDYLNNGKYLAQIFLGGSSFHTGFIRSTAKSTISTVQFDQTGPTMTVGFRCNDDVIRRVTVALPDSDTAWRPCVTVCDAVTATMLPWMDD